MSVKPLITNDFELDPMLIHSFVTHESVETLLKRNAPKIKLNNGNDYLLQVKLGRVKGSTSFKMLNTLFRVGLSFAVLRANIGTQMTSNAGFKLISPFEWVAKR